MKINLDKTELILSYFIMAIVSIYFVNVLITFDFQLSPNQMAIPGMVIAFLTSSALNIVRLKENTPSLNINRVSVFANMLTLSLATVFIIQHPYIGRLITTVPMGIITLLSIISLFSFDKKQIAHSH